MIFKQIAALLVATYSLAGLAAWEVVATDQGKRVEIDRDSIAVAADKTTTAKGRIVLDRPIVDPRTSASYRIIEVQNRFDCAERTYATLVRRYFRDEGDLLRQEDVLGPYDMPVRSGTPDDRLLREACRPKTDNVTAEPLNKTLEKVNEAAAGLRQANEALVEQAVNQDLQRMTARANKALSTPTAARSARVRKPAPPAKIAWSYGGSGGPAVWGKLSPDYATCASGRRQSPIDLSEGIAVDLEPIQFLYRPAAFRVTDTRRNLQMAVYGGGFLLLGKNYELVSVQFHRPAEISVGGKTFAMDAQLVHRSDDGKLAIVDVLLEQGTENPVVQAALNNLPLEQGGEVTPPGLRVDLNHLLPEDGRYFTFMGSLTTPPCTEDVLWIVLKQPQQISPEQLAIFARLYPPNARPVQPRNGRIVKESR
jgi:carbonic anhydrase